MNKRWLCVVCILVLLSGCMNKEAKEVFVTPVTPITENKFLYIASDILTFAASISTTK